jgi:hypothetical protein
MIDWDKILGQCGLGGTPSEVAAMEFAFQAGVLAERERVSKGCPDFNGEPGEAHVCAPGALRDAYEANRAILKARTEEMNKALTENERLKQAIRDVERMTSDPRCTMTAIGARCLMAVGGVPSNLVEVMKGFPR